MRTRTATRTDTEATHDTGGHVMNGREQLTRVALDAAARGWHVFPLAVGAKRPALHGAARCPGTGACAEGHRGWEQRATTDPHRIRRAWAHAPYNVGIATGPSGLCVLDLDTAEPGEPVPERWARHGVRGGEDVLAVVAAEAEQDVPGDTLTVATPSGGLHLYFAAPHGVELRNTGGDAGRGLGWKVDTRAGGGYVVAPGSVTGTGTYRSALDANITGASLSRADLAAALLDVVHDPASVGHGVGIAGG